MKLQAHTNLTRLSPPAARSSCVTARAASCGTTIRLYRWQQRLQSISTITSSSKDARRIPYDRYTSIITKQGRNGNQSTAEEDELQLSHIPSSKTITTLSSSNGLPSWLNLTTSSILAVALFLSGLGTGARLASSSSLASSQQTRIRSSASSPTSQQQEPILETAIPHSPDVNPKQPPVVMDAQELSADEVRTIQVFQQNTPSVVNITNIRTLQNRWTFDTMEVPAGTGSGFIWDDKGHVVTNFHVIRGASDVKVTLLDQSSYTAKVVGYDETKDVAVLQLVMSTDEKKSLRPVTLGHSSGLQVGQKVLAIGNPFGLDHTLTQGIISGLGRQLSSGQYPIKGVIQTDAAINPGNSGGVLLDSKGRLVGINTAIVDPTGRGSSSGVGLAIPIDSVKGLVDQILQYGRVIRPALGVTIAPPQLLQRLGQQGALVLEAPEGSPAAQAGILATYRDQRGNLVLGDIIVSIDGQPVKQPEDLLAVLDSRRVGDSVRVGLLRGEERIEVVVVLGDRAQVVGGQNMEQ